MNRVQVFGLKYQMQLGSGFLTITLPVSPVFSSLGSLCNYSASRPLSSSCPASSAFATLLFSDPGSLIFPSFLSLGPSSSLKSGH